MSKLLLAVAANFICLANLLAQTPAEPAAENQTLPVYNIFNDSRYTIQATILKRYVNEYTLMKDADQQTKKVFVLNPNTLESFQVNFTRTLRELSTDDTTMEAKMADATDLRDEARRLFYFYMASERVIETIDKEPNAGKLCFEKEVRIFPRFASEDAINARVTCTVEALDDGLDPCLNKIKCDTVTIPCYLKRAESQSKKDWMQEIRSFWIAKVKAETQEELRVAALAYQKQVEALTLANQTAKEDSLEMNRLTKELKEVNLLIDTIRQEGKLYELKFSKVPTTLYKEDALRGIPDLQTRDLRKPDDVEFLLTKISELRTALNPERDRINREIQTRKDSIEAISKRDSTSSSQTRKANYVQELNSLNNSLRKVKNQDSHLANLQNTVNNIYELYVDWSANQLRLYSTRQRQQSLNERIEAIADTLKIVNQAIHEMLPEKDKLCTALTAIRKRQPYVDFDISSIKIDFNDGFIENIVVVGNVKAPAGECMPQGKFLKFSNFYPIGFSRKIDYVHYKKGYSIFATDMENVRYEMELGSLFPEYIEELINDRRDYSPKDCVISIDLKTGEQCVTLTKDATFRLFEAKVYTDFVGLDDEKQPNGLVQTELSRKVFLNTFRTPVFRKVAHDWTTMGILGYINPEVTLSKIEKNNKHLVLSVEDRFVNSQYDPIKYASTLDLRRYQSFDVGFDLNLALLDLPAVKSTFYLDVGFRYGRTPIQDSIRTVDDNQQVMVENGVDEYNVNTTDFYPKIIWEIRSDERYCFSFSYSHHWLYLRDNRFQQVGNTSTYDATQGDLPKVKNEYTQIGLYATITPGGERGRIFARYHYFWQQGFWRTGFHQAQLGYSFFIFGLKKS